jgi:hypothetical protein
MTTANLWSPLLFGFLDLVHIPDEGLITLISCGKWHDTKGMEGSGDLFNDGPRLLDWRASRGQIGQRRAATAQNPPVVVNDCADLL